MRKHIVLIALVIVSTVSLADTLWKCPNSDKRGRLKYTTSGGDHVKVRQCRPVTILDAQTSKPSDRFSCIVVTTVQGRSRTDTNVLLAEDDSGHSYRCARPGNWAFLENDIPTFGDGLSRIKDCGDADTTLERKKCIAKAQGEYFRFQGVILDVVAEDEIIVGLSKEYTANVSLAEKVASSLDKGQEIAFTGKLFVIEERSFTESRMLIGRNHKITDGRIAGK